MDWQVLWRGRPYFTVFDSGSDFGALLAAWHADPQRPARLHLITLDAGPLPGFRRVPQADSAITMDLLCAPLDAALAQLDARLDAIVLHDMAGAGTHFARALARLASPGAILRASGLTQAQAHALAGAGFDCRVDGDVINAVFTSRKPPSPWARKPEPQRRALVLGAGLAGAAACERLSARGWQVTLIERHAQPATEASGNLAGISMPLLSRDDNIMTRLSRAAFLYALDYWPTLGQIKSARCGVIQLARDAQHARVQRAIAQAHAYPPAFARWMEAPEASALAGVAAPDGAWLFPQAGWMRPSSACAAMLDACGPNLVRHFGAGSVTLARRGDAWHAVDSECKSIAHAPVAIVANGAGARQLAQTAGLPLAAVRGQVTHLAEGGLPAIGQVLCREAYLTPAIDGIHSLGASYDDDAAPDLRADSQAENLTKIRSLLGIAKVGQGAPLLGRVGFRCVAPDRLPLVGALPDLAAAGRVERLREIERLPGLYGLLGYASRGLAWAPLAAELLASQLDGNPLPLEAELATALDPARFILRARRRPV
ncbi:FAD-dependent 5-carboxymethylaminomethyl-2-thiouridine(34) oxidoreductase MnmC [Massilia sp. CF038]|uniref:FAD-dependent 5-carboxymethylaminomethyl-2-thiouridine(34) oxidoreductase MnmC n=1 Tax=Massilia sp. CF038 TaxID=1881045 RepID=UPI000917E92C|nr:FAD-dependent 5-carboxymethylaminomethyl-2-thiouridine(34) oxidoreductase MnmC [Massilia sp. CF038]SHH63590.1 tRNA 5-methylaminomethyl-2-thiouridine biosynthesis bifunctional protein [Massilia sp. CF038]